MKTGGLRPIKFTWAVVCALAWARLALGQPIYYVSPNGSDTADGLTPATAWRTAEKVNGTAFSPGTQILFQRGGEWRENLSASSSGTVAAPIVYGAYGEGSKPKFWGSEVLPGNTFAKIDGTPSTYKFSIAAPINSVYADHQFLRSAALLSGSAAPGDNLAYVNANANTWYWDSDWLYVNTGGANPATSGQLYTGVSRDYIVSVSGKENVVMRDLVVDECGYAGAGYAFGVGLSTNVLLEDCEAYRAGRHHFGVINSTGFVGKGLKAAQMLPDQGFGGATAYVSYSDWHFSGHTSQWIDCVAEDPLGPYPAFYTHGEGMGDILIQNMTAIGCDISITTEGTNQHITVLGGHIQDAGLGVYGSGVVIDGLKITGLGASAGLHGDNNTLQNCLLAPISPYISYAGAVTVGGEDNTVRFNTIVFGPDAAHYASGLLLGPGTGTQFYGNILQNWPNATIRTLDGAFPEIYADYNLYNTSFWYLRDMASTPWAEWQAMGLDPHSILSDDPLFRDPASGNYSLLPGSPAIDAADIQSIYLSLLADYLGNARGGGDSFDLGAFETQKALVGDANRDGQITIADWLLLQAGLGSAGNWGDGDFDYNGVVDDADRALMVRYWGIEAGDANCDGQVTIADLMALQLMFGRGGSWENGDFNGNLRVDAMDLAILQAAMLGVPLAGDANRDGQVTVADLMVLQAHFGQAGSWADGDFSGDGVVNVVDLLLLQSAMGTVDLPPFGPADGSSVPEPSLLLPVALLGLLARRR